jgi:hypothetical protein
MPVESAADRAVFMNPDEFGVTATYVRAGGAISEVDGIFDNGVDQPEFSEPGVLSGQPTFRMRQADLPAGYAANVDALTVDGTDYTVREIRPDGRGLVTLILEEA